MKSSIVAAIRRRNWRWVIPVAISLGLVAITTAALVALDVFLKPEHLIFGYLAPTCVVAIRYGSKLATATAIIGGIIAAYYFYPPKFSIFISQPLHLAELGFFIMLAFAASQIVAALARDDAADRRARPTGFDAADPN